MSQETLDSRVLKVLKRDPIPFDQITKRVKESPADVRASLVRQMDNGVAGLIHGRGWFRRSSRWAVES